MKRIKVISLVAICLTVFLGCKKNNTVSEPVTNWSELLKGSVWAGDFNYTSGEYTGLQPFSIVMNSNGSLEWSDHQNTRPGGIWKVDGNKVTIKFPNNTSMIAELSNDSWSNFTTVTDIGFKIQRLSLSSIPKPETLENTIWKGKYGGDDIIIKFLTNTRASFKRGNTEVIGSYSISGAGIKAAGPNSLSFSTYLIFLSNATAMKGYSHALGFNNLWDARKE